MSSAYPSSPTSPFAPTAAHGLDQDSSRVSLHPPNLLCIERYGSSHSSRSMWLLVFHLPCAQKLSLSKTVSQIHPACQMWTVIWETIVCSRVLDKMRRSLCTCRQLLWKNRNKLHFNHWLSLLKKEPAEPDFLFVKRSSHCSLHGYHYASLPKT